MPPRSRRPLRLLTNLPNPDDVYVLCDGQPFERFRVTDSNTVELDTEIATQQYQIFTGYRGPGGRPAARREAPHGGRRAAAAAAAVAGPSGGDGAAVRQATSEFAQNGGPGCPCCA